MLEGLPWDRLLGNLVSKDDSEWFHCELPQEKGPNRDGSFVHVLPPLPPATPEAPAIADKTLDPKSTKSPRKRTADSDSRSWKPKRPRNTPTTRDVGFTTGSHPSVPGARVGSDDNPERARVGAPSQSPHPYSPPVPTIHNSDVDVDASDGRSVTRGEITTTEAAAELPPSPYTTIVEANILPTEHEPQPHYQPAGVDVRSASTRSWAFATVQGDSIDAPICIDLDAKFLHVRRPRFFDRGVVFDVRSALTDNTASRIQR